MSSTAVCVHPSQAQLTEFFGVEPLEAAPEDGYWAYGVGDEWGASVRFSFDAHAGSVQVVLSAHGRELATVSQEGARRIEVGDAGGTRTLVCEFGWRGAESVLRLSVRPAVAVRWATLRTE
jgi:hypothetical protein